MGNAITDNYDRLSRLAMIIMEEIEYEFGVKHLSGNLLNTIKVIALADDIQIVIPAQVYNFYEYWKHGAIVPSNRKGDKSYASSLDTVGSEFMVYSPEGKRYLSTPHNHTDWVNRVIDKALNRWQMEITAKDNLQSKIIDIERQ